MRCILYYLITLLGSLEPDSGLPRGQLILADLREASGCEKLNWNRDRKGG